MNLIIMALMGCIILQNHYGIVEVLCLPTWCMAGWPEGVVSLSRLGVGHVGECRGGGGGF